MMLGWDLIPVISNLKATKDMYSPSVHIPGNEFLVKVWGLGKGMGGRDWKSGESRRLVSRYFWVNKDSSSRNKRKEEKYMRTIAKGCRDKTKKIS